MTSGVFGAFWEASGCQIVPKRAPRASQISKNSLPECIAFSIAFPTHFLEDFQWFFESRAQVRVCKTCMIYMCFCMFFASRLFFERVGLTRQSSMRISSKNRAKHISKRPQICEFLIRSALWDLLGIFLCLLAIKVASGTLWGGERVACGRRVAEGWPACG